MVKKESEKERFIRVAREHECDETGIKFMEKLKATLSKKPVKKEKKVVKKKK